MYWLGDQDKVHQRGQVASLADMVEDAPLERMKTATATSAGRRLGKPD